MSIPVSRPSPAFARNKYFHVKFRVESTCACPKVAHFVNHKVSAKDKILEFQPNPQTQKRTRNANNAC